MADPDLQIREGPGHPDPKISRGEEVSKTFFSALDTQYMHNFKTGSTKGTNDN